LATKIIYLTGKAKWAKVRTPDEKYDNFTIDLFPTKESWGEFKASGMEVRPKRADEGEYITLRRPNNKLIKNEIVTFGPPKVLNPDETVFEGLIGNGSTVTLKVAVYDTIKGKGHRLEAVRVDDLVVYEGAQSSVFPTTPAATTEQPVAPPPKASKAASSTAAPPF
jgi:hypothetical protein